MKTFIALMLLSIAPYAAQACDGDKAANETTKSGETLHITQAAPTENVGDATKSVLKIDGMKCSSCEDKIKASLMKLPGVESVVISRKAGTAAVKYVNGTQTPEKIAAAVRNLGYKVVL